MQHVRFESFKAITADYSDMYVYQQLFSVIPTVTTLNKPCYLYILVHVQTHQDSYVVRID